MVQCGGFLRLDGRALRRRCARPCWGWQSGRNQNPAGGGANRFADLHPQRAGDRAKPGHAVNPACGQGAGVAPCDVGWGHRGYVAVSPRRGRLGARHRHPFGRRAAPHVRGPDPGPAQSGRELEPKTKKRSRHGGRVAQPFYCRNGPRQCHHARRPARKTACTAG